MDEKPLDEKQLAVLKLLLSRGVLRPEDAGGLASLINQGLVRDDHNGWSITIEGHLRYLRELARML